MKTIKITPQNIPGQVSMTIQLSDSDLFYGKAKKQVSEKMKGIPSDEFVFFSKNKQTIIHEDDRVVRYFIRIFRIQNKNDPIEVDLYLTSDLVKKVLGGGVSQAFNPQQTQTFGEDKSILEAEIKKLKSEMFKQENQKRAEIADLNATIDELRQKQLDYQAIIQENREQYENRLKGEEDQRANFIEKFRQEMVVSKDLRIKLMQEEQKYQDLLEKQREAERELKFQQKFQEQSRASQNQQQSTISDAQVQNLKFQLETLERNYQEEQFQKKKEIEKNKQLNQQLAELQSRINQKVEELNVARCQAEVDQQNLQEQLKNQESKAANLRDTIASMKKDKLQLQQQFQFQETNKYQMQCDLDAIKQQANTLRTRIQELEQEIELKEQKLNEVKIQKDNQINKIVNKEESYQQEIAEFKQKERKLLQKIRDYDQQVKQLQSQNESLEEQLKTLQEVLKKRAEDNELAQKKLFNELDKEKEKAQQAEQKRAQLANRVKQNAVRKTGEGKIISAIESLTKSMENPFNFLTNDNIMTNDLDVQVEIIKVDQNKAIESLTKLSDPDISKYVIREPVGVWRGKRSINCNGEGTKRKCFLFKIQSSEGDRFNNAVFVIKELIGYERINTVEKALIVAQNNQIAKVLATFYQEKLRNSGEKPAFSFKYPDQYLLLQDGNYYIAEQLREGKFTKFNGEGDSPDKDPKITSFLNGFSIFSYHATQNILMVTNIQGINTGTELVLYDPIVSSPEGILGEEDLAEPHILQFLSNYKENPKNFGKQFLSSLSIKI